MRISKKNIVFIVLSCFLTVVIFSYLLKTVKLADVKQLLKEIDYRFVFAFIVLSLTGTAFRTWRYLLTLRPAGYQPPKLALFLVTLVRNMCSDLLPARIGSAIYIYLANTRLGIPVAVASNSFALSLLFDLVALGPLVVIALLFAGSDFPMPKTILLAGSIAIFLFTFSTVWFLPNLTRFVSVAIRSFFLIPCKFRTNLANFCLQVASECDTTKTNGTFFNIFLASCFVRLCKYGSLYVFLVGMLLPLGYGINEISPIICTVGILAAEMAASLPVSGIAGFGAYEGAWSFTFSLMGFPSDIAKITAITHHLFTQVWGYGIGLLSLGLITLSIFINLSSKKKITTLNYSYDGIAQLGLFLLGLSLSLLAFAIPHEEMQSNSKLIYTEVPESEKPNLNQLAQILPGKLYFDSNRSGTFGIYSVDTDGTNLKKIIDDPKWHEVYPDISPDGKKIVYAKTRSHIRQSPSEVWIANSDGSNPKKLADKASFPTFDRDGKLVYLEVERRRVDMYNIETGEQSQIFPFNKKAFKGRQLVKPRISTDRSTVALTTDNPSTWHAWIAPLGKGAGSATMIHPGCEPTFFPDNNRLAWIKRSGAKADSGIMYFKKDSNEIGVIKDDGGPLGHEYFPTITADGRFLLYSACPENQHDHITSNYNLFVYDMQQDKTWRVTFDQFTNRWPKYRSSVKY